MKQKHQPILFSLLLLLFFACNTSKVEQISGEGATIFTNVNVVPMTGPEIIENQTVIVRDGKIEKIISSDKIHQGPTRERKHTIS